LWQHLTLVNVPALAVGKGVEADPLADTSGIRECADRFC
jgi:hypothetical protein